jgi:hypothetical protein
MYFCNYCDIWMCNKNILIKLEKPENIEEWCPTCIFYKNNNLYIANYLGKNILIAEILNNKIIILKNIKTDFMKGPEGLDISLCNSYIGIADFDASLAIIYNLNNFELITKINVGSAHSIVFDNKSEYFICTGLSPAKLIKIDLKGNKLLEKDGFGWNSNEYLWPTCIIRHNDNFLVSDAHKGTITLIDENLTEIKKIGGNGCSNFLFNMPYGIYLNKNDELYITDTFKKRIVKYKENDFIEEYNFNPDLNLIINEKKYQSIWIPNNNDVIYNTKEIILLDNEFNINDEVIVEVYFSIFTSNKSKWNGCSNPSITGFEDFIEFDINNKLVNNENYELNKIYKTKILDKKIILNALHSENYYEYNRFYINIIPVKYEKKYIKSISKIDYKPLGNNFLNRRNNDCKILLPKEFFFTDSHIFYCDYNAISNNNNYIKLNSMFIFSGGIFYFIFGKNFYYEDHLLLSIFSPQNNCIILLYKKYIIPISNEINFWLINNEIKDSDNNLFVINNEILELIYKCDKIDENIRKGEDIVSQLKLLYTDKNNLFDLNNIDKYPHFDDDEKIFLIEINNIHNSNIEQDIKNCRYYDLYKIYCNKYKNLNCRSLLLMSLISILSLIKPISN